MEMRFLWVVAPLAVAVAARAVTLAREIAKQVALGVREAAPQIPAAHQLGAGGLAAEWAYLAKAPVGQTPLMVRKAKVAQARAAQG